MLSFIERKGGLKGDALWVLKKGGLLMKFTLGLGLIVLGGCVAKSGFEERFKESRRLVAPSFSVTGVSSGDFTFSLVGDVHLGGNDTSRLRVILQAAQDHNDAFIIFLGDMIDKGVKADFETFIAQVKEFGFENRAIYVIGNHDIFDDGWTHFRDLMGPSHYDVTLGNCRFLILDSADGMIGEGQTEWLEKRLKEPAAVHTIVLSHYLPVVPGQRTYLKLANAIESMNLMKLLTRFGVKAWLGGHYHSFTQAEIDKVTYLVAGGGGGRRMEPLKEFFYVRATVQNSRLSFQPHTLDLFHDLKHNILQDP